MKSGINLRHCIYLSPSSLTQIWGGGYTYTFPLLKKTSHPEPSFPPLVPTFFILNESNLRRLSVQYLTHVAEFPLMAAQSWRVLCLDRWGSTQPWHPSALDIPHSKLTESSDTSCQRSTSVACSWRLSFDVFEKSRNLWTGMFYRPFGLENWLMLTSQTVLMYPGGRYRKEHRCSCIRVQQNVKLSFFVIKLLALKTGGRVEA